jgi:hypothetical protein
LTGKIKLFLLGAFFSGWLFLVGPTVAYGNETGGSEQVIVSPQQQAVNSALSTATTEVQQAINATTAATTAISEAQAEVSSAQSAVSSLSSSVSTAQAALNDIQTAVNTINSIDLTVTPIDQSSQTVQDAKDTVVDGQTAINNINTTAAQTEITQLTTERTEAAAAQTTAQTELTQANIAIDNAQTAVNNLQATIGTTTNVLAGVDDAGIRMNLPFAMQMGGTLYNDIYVGSNATITFGVDQGWVYYQTPDAPSVSIAGWDWTTWSTGTGITYSTTGTSLDIAWDLRPFPQQDASTQMVQVRFNADVNPTDGAWMANVTAVGPIPNGARFNYRETTNGTIIPITDTNSGSGFAGQISQGSAFTPYVDPNTSTVQAAVDAANATITQLNQNLSPVVAQNSINNSTISSLQSNINSLNNTVNSAISTKNSLQSTLNTRAATLTNTINNNIPTPAPILAEPIIEGTTVIIAPELPAGYTANTWFYQVISNDPDAANPYEGQTLNTDGAPESIELTGLTEGASYTIRVANWSGPVSQYTETVISIPATQSSNLTAGGGSAPSYDPVDNNEQTQPDETTLDEGENTETEPTPEDPVDETPSEDDESQDTDTPESDDSSSTDEQDNSSEETQDDSDESSQDNDTLSVEEIQEAVSDLIADGAITASDVEAVLEALSADGEITTSEVVNLSEALSADGTLTLAEKDLVAEALVESADGAPIEAAAIQAAGLEYRDLPPQIPVEVREDANGNPVVITAEVASALLTLESPAALAGAIVGCFNPDEAIEGLTEEQKCEVFKALANIGADMSPQERQDAKEVLVAAILVGQVILGSSILRIRG